MIAEHRQLYIFGDFIPTGQNYKLFLCHVSGCPADKYVFLPKNNRVETDYKN